MASGTHAYSNLGRAVLTLYVMQRTGTYHDREVSCLISAAGEYTGFSAQDLASWRKDHRELLKWLAPYVNELSSVWARPASAG
jgi:hypothetical protein